jgi:translocator protein
VRNGSKGSRITLRAHRSRKDELAVFVFTKKYTPHILGALLCVTVGLLSGYFSNSGPGEWYRNLTKPSFNPPAFIFGPVWTVLYVMMGVALGILWQGYQKNKYILLLFALQFFLNIVWSFLFFSYHRIDLALIDIILLWTTLAVLMRRTWDQKGVFFLLLPYMLWVSFASILNGTLYWLNP